MEQARTDLQRSLIQSSSQFDQLSSEKLGLQVALDELRLKFDREKQNLLHELENLRLIRQTLDQEKLARDQEIRQIRERAHLSAEELKTAEAKVRILEQQLEQQLNQNRNLNDDVRVSKLQNNNLQRSLNDFQLIIRERDRLQSTVNELENELGKLQIEVKTQDTRYNDVQLVRTKLADEKTAMMKEIVRLETLNRDLQHEIEQLRLVVRERNESLQSKEKEIGILRKKEQNYLTTVETLQVRLNDENTKKQDLEIQNKQLQRQLNAEMQNTVNVKRDLNDYILRSNRLQDEVGLLQRDKENLNGQLNTLQLRLSNEETLNNSLRAEVQDLEDRVKEIDRLKSLEDLIQTQRWEDMTQMAQTMQSLSKTMARATSPTATRKRIELS